jgi:hypothetical protein
MPPREFIAPPGIEAKADQRLADFWARTFAAVPGGA